MIDEICRELEEHRQGAYLLLRRLRDMERPFLLATDLRELCETFCEEDEGCALKGGPMAHMLCRAQEAALRSPWIYIAVRYEIAEWVYLRFHTEEMLCEAVDAVDFLDFKERLVEEQQDEQEWVLEIDLAPFERGFPKLKEARSIGRGVQYLNRHLSGRLFSNRAEGERRLLEFLSVHQLDGAQLMLNELIETPDQLRRALRKADALLGGLESETPWKDFEHDLARLGFAPGWGRTAELAREMLGLLSELLEAPDPNLLENLLSRIPMVTRLAIISPHGYFGQSNVLGKPDTGGQVVYILDQVRAMEQEMRRQLHERGIEIEPQIVVLSRLIPEAGDTTCGQRIERIIGTEQARILRVPFRRENGEIVPHWIRRFNVWPYLERFSIEAHRELLAELQGRPDLIIGNYSDGNLVATLLAGRMGVTQCNIAHALEKTKYLYSALNWKQYEEEFRFSCQFTADLIAMNAADFIVTSTYQEIAGRPESEGQYESYGTFTMPGLYRVVNGVDPFDPKFNIVSPGADSNVFFPFSDKDRRSREMTAWARKLLEDDRRDGVRGRLAEPDKPLLFAMSRLDTVKNVCGFVEWYAGCPELRERANLFVVGGHLDPDASNDEDEHGQIRRLHALMDEHRLDDVLRWAPMQSDKNVVGELYRIVADRRGAFVQPALFEAFGLTVVEAMSSGLPVFATCYGGPLEIIEDGCSGFHIDPNHGDRSAQHMADFFRRCGEDPAHWSSISEGALERVRTHYTWNLYARRLLSLSRVYGFWKHIFNIEREETRRYLEMFYGLMYRPRAARIPMDA